MDSTCESYTRRVVIDSGPRNTELAIIDLAIPSCETKVRNVVILVMQSVVHDHSGVSNHTTVRAKITVARCPDMSSSKRVVVVRFSTGMPHFRR
jgi:hypothetical protein